MIFVLRINYFILFFLRGSSVLLLAMYSIERTFVHLQVMNSVYHLVYRVIYNQIPSTQLQFTSSLHRVR